NGRAVSLQQTTQYPLDSTVEIAVKAEAPQTFGIALRIPAWAGPRTAIAVNGKRQANPKPGTFHEIRREWRDGDRIVLTLDRTLRLEAVDAKQPDPLAVMQGPLPLFAVGDRFLPFTRKDLMSVRQTAVGASDWRVSTADG